MRGLLFRKNFNNIDLFFVMLAVRVTTEMSIAAGSAVFIGLMVVSGLIGYFWGYE